MTAVAIRKEQSESDETLFRAIAGDRQAVGRTMGEALDALTAQWEDNTEETTALIQRFQPDVYFTAAQYARMQTLRARLATLTQEERAELEALIDAELDATVARTDSLLQPQQP